MNNQVYYKKEKNISIPVIGLKLTNIPIKEEVRLDFYQKFIILLLEKGFKADNRNILCEKIAEILNFNDKVVYKFLMYLIDRNYLLFDDSNKIFKLKDSFTYNIDNENKIMYADMKTNKADCNNILYINGYDAICLENQIRENELYSFKKGKNDRLDRKIILDLEKQKDIIKEAIKESFKNTNYHLEDKIEYLISDDCKNCNIDFNVLATYQYDKDTKKIARVDIDYPSDNIFPIQCIDDFVNALPEDNTLPRFIEFGEEFYDKQHDTSILIDATENKIQALESNLEPIKKEYEEQTKLFNQKEKEHKAELKELEKIKNDLQKQVNIKENQIKQNQNLVEKYKKQNKTIAEEYQKTLDNIIEQKQKLEKQLTSKQSSFDELTEKYKKELEDNKAKIDSNEVIIKQKNKEIEKAKKDNEQTSKYLNELIGNFRDGLDPKTIKVIDMYKNEDLFFCKYVRDICIGIDRAVSASDSGALDNMVYYIDDIRIKSRKACQVVLDLLSGRNAPKIADYFSNSFKKADLQKLFEKNGSNKTVMDRFIEFHELTNATTHFIENGDKSKSNKATIENFKKETAKKRREILFSVDDFFINFKLNNQQKHSCSKKLSIF